MAAASIIGVISDTHGLLRPEAEAALAGADLIIHAGDVGGAEILDALRRIARVVAVRGNVDTDAWGRTLPMTELVEHAGVSIYVVHRIDDLDIEPAAAGVQAVIYGHSHQPSIERRRGVLHLNPGSAGPRRFRLPTTIARLEVRDGRITDARIVDLAAGA
ncbi:MAG TPA: metallophosphoesterase family protein [Vicinamibacterales bacterium]